MRETSKMGMTSRMNKTNKGPESVRKFIHQNLLQRNQNHSDQDTAQGIDYKLKEYNKF